MKLPEVLTKVRMEEREVGHTRLRGQRIYEELPVRRLNLLGKAAVAIAALPFAVGLFSDRYVNILGDHNTAQEIPAAEYNTVAHEDAKLKYEQTFKKASPAGKFALQYLTQTDVNTRVRVEEPNNGKGFLGFVTGHTPTHIHILTTLGDGCLNKTAYDINGGDIDGMIEGVFSSGTVHGEVPTAAANAFVDATQPDVLVIQSGHTNSRDLRFTGVIEGSQLMPADQQTHDVLNTYGCQPDALTTQDDVYEGTHSSPWVK